LNLRRYISDRKYLKPGGISTATACVASSGFMARRCRFTLIRSYERENAHTNFGTSPKLAA